MQVSYRKALLSLNAAGLPYLVGGAHGLYHYAGIRRETKDLDLFVLPDIMHLLLNCGRTLDWSRLLDRFDSHWHVLFSYLTLFGYAYPSERSIIPRWLILELSNRLKQDINNNPPQRRICQGTLLSKAQYQMDIESWGFEDARLIPIGKMTADEISRWNE